MLYFILYLIEITSCLSRFLSEHPNSYVLEYSSEEGVVIIGLSKDREELNSR